MVDFSNLSLDIIVEIINTIKYSSMVDCCSFGSTNRAIRDAAIPFIFKKIYYGSPCLSFMAIFPRAHGRTTSIDTEPVIQKSISMNDETWQASVISGNAAICNAARHFKILSTGNIKNIHLTPVDVFKPVFEMPKIESLIVDIVDFRHREAIAVFNRRIPSLRRLLLPNPSWLLILPHLPDIDQVEIRSPWPVEHWEEDRDLNFLYSLIDRPHSLKRLHCRNQPTQPLIDCIQKAFPTLESLGITGELEIHRRLETIRLFKKFKHLRHLELAFVATDLDTYPGQKGDKEWQLLNERHQWRMKSLLKIICDELVVPADSTLRFVTLGDHESTHCPVFELDALGNIIEVDAVSPKIPYLLHNSRRTTNGSQPDQIAAMNVH